MFNLASRHSLTRHETVCPAVTARTRLLKDRALRRNSAPAPISWVSPSRSQGHLSPAIQRQHALNIARSFEHHYLAGITFDPSTHTTVAVIRPARHKSAAHERAYSIRINAHGEVVVSPLVSPSSALWQRAIMRALIVVVPVVIFFVTVVCVA